MLQIYLYICKYSLEKGELGLSFNGGKDCTVLVYLIALCLYGRKNSSSDFEKFHIPTVFVDRSDSFAELEEFVTDMETRQLPTLLAIERRKEESMREALFQFTQGHPDMKAIFVGVRRSDPYSSNIYYHSILTNKLYSPYIYL